MAYINRDFFLLIVLRSSSGVNFSDACSLNKRISTCDNHSKSSRRRGMRYSSFYKYSDIRKCREGSRDFCNIYVFAPAGKELFNDADMTRFKIRVVAWKMRSLAEH